MSSTTPRVGLYMPADDGSEPINVATDLNDNMEKLDSTMGFVPATSVTPPSTTYNGMARYNTDDSRVYYYKNGTTWTQLLAAGANFLANLLIDSAYRIGIGTATPGALIDIAVSSITAVPIMKVKATGEAYHRIELNHDGIRIGGGTTAPETRIYRPTTNQLNIVGSVAMSNNLSVTGSTAVTSLDVSGNMSIGGTINSDVNIVGNFSATGIGMAGTRRKTVDLARSSNAVSTVDSDFDFPLEANTTYLVEAAFAVAGVNTGDFKCSWVVPSGATGPRWTYGMNGAGTDSNAASVQLSVFSLTTDVTYGVNTTAIFTGVQEVLTITTGATAGNLQFKWAQGTSTATATTLRAGSIMRIRKVA